MESDPVFCDVASNEIQCVPETGDRFVRRPEASDGMISTVGFE